MYFSIGLAALFAGALIIFLFRTHPDNRDFSGRSQAERADLRRRQVLSWADKGEALGTLVLLVGLVLMVGSCIVAIYRLVSPYLP